MGKIRKATSPSVPVVAGESLDPIDRLLLFLKNNLICIFLLYALIFLVITIVIRICFDYRAYLLQWRVVVQGRDPWSTPVKLGMNAYGPLHNVYGLLFLINSKLPRILGSTLWLAAVWPIARRILDANGAAQRRLWLLSAISLNPFVWGWVAVFGSNDAFVAVFLAVALLAIWNGASVTAGVFVALAGLMKFYPMLVLPFIAFDRRKLDLPLVVTALVVFSAGMAIAGAVWGWSVLAPVAFATGREPSQLSIYEFITASTLSPLDGVRIPSRIIQGIFIVVLLIVFLVHIRRHGGQVEGMVLGLLTILTAYPLGHFQFYLPLILITPLALVLEKPSRTVENSLMSVLALVSFFAACYELFGGLTKPPWLYIRQNCSLPTVVAEVTAIVALLRGAERPGTTRAPRTFLRSGPGSPSAWSA